MIEIRESQLDFHTDPITTSSPRTLDSPPLLPILLCQVQFLLTHLYHCNSLPRLTSLQYHNPAMRNLSDDKAEQKRRIAQVATITGITEAQATKVCPRKPLLPLLGLSTMHTFNDLNHFEVFGLTDLHSICGQHHSTPKGLLICKSCSIRRSIALLHTLFALVKSAMRVIGRCIFGPVARCFRSKRLDFSFIHYSRVILSSCHHSCRGVLSLWLLCSVESRDIFIHLSSLRYQCVRDASCDRQGDSFLRHGLA